MSKKKRKQALLSKEKELETARLNNQSSKINLLITIVNGIWALYNLFKH